MSFITRSGPGGGHATRCSKCKLHPLRCQCDRLLTGDFTQADFDALDDIGKSAVSLFHTLETLDLPKGTKLRGTREGTWITEPGKEPYLLKDAAP